jgi:hypothetical protein
MILIGEAALLVDLVGLARCRKDLFQLALCAFDFLSGHERPALALKRDNSKLYQARLTANRRTASGTGDRAG